MRKFAIDEKKEKVDLGTAKVDVTTKWDSGKLSQDIELGSLKITRDVSGDRRRAPAHRHGLDGREAGAEGRAQEPAAGARGGADRRPIYDKAGSY